jgi:hypothetical protein
MLLTLLRRLLHLRRLCRTRRRSALRHAAAARVAGPPNAQRQAIVMVIFVGAALARYRLYLRHMGTPFSSRHCTDSGAGFENDPPARCILSWRGPRATFATNLNGGKENVDTCSARRPRLTQRLPANQRAAEREKRLVDAGSSAAAMPLHATSPTRINFRRFCHTLLGLILCVLKSL